MKSAGERVVVEGQKAVSDRCAIAKSEPRIASCFSADPRVTRQSRPMMVRTFCERS